MRTKLERLAQAYGLDVNRTMCLLIDSEARRIGASDPAHLPLTDKQRLVIQQLRSGLSVKEVATTMGVTEGTVRTHILRARGRLGHSDLLALRFL